MANIQRDRVGLFLQFYGPDRRRHKLRLTGMPEREAERFAERLNELRRAVRFGATIDEALLEWASELSDDLAGRLADYGLLQPRAAVVHTPKLLGPFVEWYVTQRSDVKASTATTYGHTKRNLLEFFGASRDLKTITAGDADGFSLWLRRKKTSDQNGCGLSENTANRRCRFASQFFRAAIRNRIIADNPFDGVGGAVKSNKARVFFVTREDAAKVLEACPDLEWRLIFALARYGGLRTPSEHRGLRVNEIDWARNRFLVHSPKTEHHAGGAERWVPIFPELAPLFRDACEALEPGTIYLINRYRHHANLGTSLKSIVRRAGLTPWPKIFHNLRATRQTELAAIFPLHIVCAWLGNKAAIAQEHYLQVTDADFNRASEGGAFLAQSGAILAPTGTGVVRLCPPKGVESPEENAESAVFHGLHVPSRVGVTGRHDSHSTAGNAVARTANGAIGGAINGDEDLQRVLAGWADLSAEMKSVIVKLVEASTVASQQGAR